MDLIKELVTEACKHTSLEEFEKALLIKISNEEISTSISQFQYLMDKYPYLKKELYLEDIGQELICESSGGEVGMIYDRICEERFIEALSPESKKLAGEYLKDIFDVTIKHRTIYCDNN